MHTKYIYLFAVASLFSHASFSNTLEQTPKTHKAAFYLANKPKERPLEFLLSPQDRGWHELNVADLITKIDRTISGAGSIEFARLVQPIYNTKELESRRAIINTLINNPKLVQVLSRELEDFSRNYEAFLAHFLHPDAHVSFIIDKGQGEIPISSSVGQIAFETFMTALLVQNIAYEGLQVYNNWGAVRNVANGVFQRGWIGYNAIGHVGIVGAASYLSAKKSKQTIDNINLADHYVLQTAKALDLTRLIAQELKSSELRDSEIDRAFEAVTSPQLMSLEFSKGTSWAKDRLANEGSWLRYVSVLGSLSTYDHFKELGPDLLRVIQAFGILDAYLSVAKLHSEWTKQGSPVTLAQFSSSRDVQFSFESLSNPLVPDAITNHFALGGAVPAKHAVITGPHKCGKTTIMRSAAYGFILGQSILLVPATKAELTPLTVMKTYFNVGDNILEGLSSFTSEHKRVADLTFAASKITPQTRALFLVDEPYAKTIQAIGEPRVADFLRKTSKIDRLSVVLATHFEEPSHLEAETNGLVKNFQPEIDEFLDPTYKIIDGAATWWFHDIEKRNLFIEKLLQ